MPRLNFSSGVSWLSWFVRTVPLVITAPGSRDTGNSQFIPAVVKCVFIRDCEEEKHFQVLIKPLCVRNVYSGYHPLFLFFCFKCGYLSSLKGMVSEATIY